MEVVEHLKDLEATVSLRLALEIISSFVQLRAWTVSPVFREDED